MGYHVVKGRLALLRRHAIVVLPSSRHVSVCHLSANWILLMLDCHILLHMPVSITLHGGHVRLQDDALMHSLLSMECTASLVRFPGEHKQRGMSSGIGKGVANACMRER